MKSLFTEPGRRRWVTVMILLGVLLATGSAIFSSVTGRTHDFANRCDLCHLVYPEPGEKGIFIQDVDALCIPCHELSLSNSHPSEILPTIEIPEIFPLDWQGRITCSSCHDPHATPSDDNPGMLRTGLRGRAFCLSCHDNLFERGTHRGEGSIAHTRGWTPDMAQGLDQFLDPVSLDCLSCHSDSVAPIGDLNIADSGAYRYTGSGRSHPIGIDYALAVSKNNELRSLEELSPDISLYGGKVGCGSCHSPYSHRDMMLVMGMGRSALCLECHLK